MRSATSSMLALATTPGVAGLVVMEVSVLWPQSVIRAAVWSSGWGSVVIEFVEFPLGDKEVITTSSAPITPRRSLSLTRWAFSTTSASTVDGKERSGP